MPCTPWYLSTRPHVDRAGRATASKTRRHPAKQGRICRDLELLDARALLSANSTCRVTPVDLGGDPIAAPRSQAPRSAAFIRTLNYQPLGTLEHQSPFLTLKQIESIPDSWWLRRMPETARWALTTDQVQAINTAEVSIDYLLAGQRDKLTVEQLQDLTGTSNGCRPSRRPI